MTRIVCISDTHLQPIGPLPEGDILVHAGDATFLGELYRMEEFCRMMAAQPHKHKFYVPGNHDLRMELELVDRGMQSNCRIGNRYEPPIMCQMFDDAGIDLLYERPVTVAGLTFWGSPWTPNYGGWAFGYAADDADDYWTHATPQKADVVVTHGPPKGILDWVEEGDHVGCPALLKQIKRLKPKLHVFGHIHEAYGQLTQDGTVFVNASQLDHHYRYRRPPIVVDL